MIRAVGWDQLASSERRPTTMCVPDDIGGPARAKARWSHPTMEDSP